MYGTSRRHHVRPASGGRRPSRSAVGLALASVAVALLTAGCSTEDAVCSDGEYPVLTVGSTGSACVSNDEEPPKGYTRYPEGKVPKHVDDKWYTYWETHTVDENGKITDAPGYPGE
ncbi:MULTISPECIES: SCO0607 family lipoprotein [unclassified Streptomyces]|uniref:SCO0607 family lipoprotein n=1 Tax=unclassified Streptomyces TaxID=2593676 RepID=UPI0036EB352B